MMTRSACIAVTLWMVTLAPAAAPAAETSVDDAYVAGYAAAVLERELKLQPRSLTVRHGVVTLDAADLQGVDVTRVADALSRVRGFVRVDIRLAPTSPGVLTGEAPTTTTTTVTPKVIKELHSGIMPGGQLFQPLVADPRWPHFAAAYHYYVNEGQITHVGAVTFGETFTLYRDQLGRGWWEVGIQAGVFSVFDLAAESVDLINADYMAAVVVGYRYDNVSALARLFHQSSHIGDEFLLRNRVRNRVNLSFESIDLRLAYDLFDDALRVYGGGGYLFDQEPASLRPWSLQWGAEFRSPWPGPQSSWRPIAALDMQNREENDWQVDISARAGVQFEGVLASRNLQLLLEYFRGHSPNGQFYKQEVDYLGVGAHFHF
jgi:hypothetical protein